MSNENMAKIKTVRQARKELFSAIKTLEIMNRDQETLPGQEQPGSTYVVEKAEFNKETRMFTWITGVNNIRRTAIDLVESMQIG